LGTAARLLSLAGFGLVFPAAEACRYNVRDLGFVELEPAAYVLYVCPPTPATSPESTAFVDSVQVCLADSNIRPISLAAGDWSRQKHARQLEPLATLPPPIALLVSPDAQALVVALPATREHLTNTLGSLAHSPTREAVLRETARTFGAILFLPGTDTTAAAAARRAIGEAIAALRQTMLGLPKPVAAPPSLVTLDPADLGREQVLLWSLGLGTQAVAEPRLAVLYGRGRWIGPLMRGPEIAAANLTRLFDIIGADCECGMDLSWTRGTPVPAVWTPALHQAATTSLGFDPDDPLVRIEASRILGRYASANAEPPAAGYREIPIDSPPATATDNAATNAAPARPPARPPPAPGALAEVSHPWRPAVAVLIGLGTLAGVACLWVVWRQRRD
jgi:hypothetical protein